MGIIEFISTYDFLIYALVVGALVALCAALLGTSLVLRRLSMIGDGLSHVAFGAVTLAAALNAQPLYVALPIVIIALPLTATLSTRSMASCTIVWQTSREQFPTHPRWH